MFASSMNGVESTLLLKSDLGLMYLGDQVNGGMVNNMGHLACFAGESSNRFGILVR